MDVFDVEVKTYSDYYPFGSSMPGRNHNPGEYRFGYQGSESDNEISGSGNSYTTYFRQLDVRLGRWWSVDPETAVVAWISPYVQNGSSPILSLDKGGDSPTFYYDEEGNRLFDSKDGLSTAVTIIDDRNIEDFKREIQRYKMFGVQNNYDVNTGLRDYGISYHTDDVMALWNDNRRNQDHRFSETSDGSSAGGKWKNPETGQYESFEYTYPEFSAGGVTYNGKDVFVESASLTFPDAGDYDVGTSIKEAEKKATTATSNSGGTLVSIFHGHSMPRGKYRYWFVAGRLEYGPSDPDEFYKGGSSNYRSMVVDDKNLYLYTDRGNDQNRPTITVPVEKLSNNK